MSNAVSHLVVVPENPLPPGGEAAAITARDGVGLRTAFWPRENARGTICIFPGRSEFIEKYFETTGELQDRGFAVAALDWRGQGGSARELPDTKKGHVDDFELYLRDIDAFLERLEAIGAPKPWFGLGHSMGGAILLLASAKGEKRLRRMVLTAPMMGLYGPGSAATARHIIQTANVAGLGAMYVPGSGSKAPTGYSPFEGNPLTSDPDRYRRQAAIMIAGNEVTIGAPTIAWLAAAYRLMHAMQTPEFGLEMAIPTMVVAAGADTIVSTTTVESLCARMRGVQSYTIVGARHEILMERDPIRAQFWAAFDAFVPGAESAERIIDNLPLDNGAVQH